MVKKSPNEKTNVVIAYPIKRGRTGGTSIWKELEIVDLLIQYEFVTKAGAWIKVSPDIVEEHLLQTFDESMSLFPWIHVLIVK